MSNATAVSATDFDQNVLQSDVPVLVDFWAAWCGPCRMIAPTLDTLAEEYQGQAKIVKVDIDSEPHLAEQFGIRSIPALLLFKGGEKVGELIGAHPKATISNMIASAL